MKKILLFISIIVVLNFVQEELFAANLPPEKKISQNISNAIAYKNKPVLEPLVENEETTGNKKSSIKNSSNIPIESLYLRVVDSKISEVRAESKRLDLLLLEIKDYHKLIGRDNSNFLTIIRWITTIVISIAALFLAAIQYITYRENKKLLESAREELTNWAKEKEKIRSTIKSDCDVISKESKDTLNKVMVEFKEDLELIKTHYSIRFMLEQNIKPDAKEIYPLVTYLVSKPRKEFKATYNRLKNIYTDDDEIKTKIMKALSKVKS